VCPPSYRARATTAAMSRSSIGSVSAHQNWAFDANSPGRMIVDSRPAAAIRRSTSAWKRASGFGYWKNGCGVLCGEERKTTRRVCEGRRSTIVGAVPGGAVQRRETAPMPCSAASSDSGTEVARHDLDGRR
jgi:hypothetical protein